MTPREVAKKCAEICDGIKREQLKRAIGDQWCGPDIAEDCADEIRTLAATLPDAPQPASAPISGDRALLPGLREALNWKPNTPQLENAMTYAWASAIKSFIHAIEKNAPLSEKQAIPARLGLLCCATCQKPITQGTVNDCDSGEACPFHRYRRTGNDNETGGAR